MHKSVLPVAVAVLSLGLGALSQPPALAQHRASDAAHLTTGHLAEGVVYEADGRPAAGVCVLAVSTVPAAGPTAGPAGLVFAKSAPNGQYSLATRAAGSYVVRYYGCRSGVSIATRTVTIRGTGATPLPAVRFPKRALTGAAGTYGAELAAEGVTVPHRPAFRAAAPSRASRPAAGIYGKVTSPSGHPLKNICVAVIGKSFALGTSTSRNGTYRIPVAPSLTGRYPVEFTSTCDSAPFAAGPWAPQWYKDKFSPAGATKVLLKPGHVVRHIDAVMQPQGVVTGTVTGAGGRRLAGVCAVLTTARGVEVAQASTRTDGRYRLVGLDPGRYRVLLVACEAADYGSEWWPHAKTASGARPIRVRLGQATRGINIRLVQLGTIAGTVRLGNSRGMPLRGICVTAVASSGLPFGFSASTARNGIYAVRGLLPGTYEVFANPGCDNNGNYTNAVYPRLVTAADGVTVHGINISLQTGGEVSGTVTSAETGKPLRGICVSDDIGDSTITKANGTYLLDQLFPERTTVEFSGGCGNKGSYAPQWYPGQDNVAGGQTLTVKAGQDITGIDAAMLPGATISGQVTTPAGHPASGVCVSIVGRLDIYFGFELDDLGIQAITGKSGSYTVANLAADDYAVAFVGGCETGGSHAAQQWYPGQPTDATAGLVSTEAGQAVQGINATVRPGGSVSGKVTAPSGKPAQFACVYALSTKTGLAGGNDTLGFDGQYAISGLAPGRYFVEVENCSLNTNVANQRYRSPVTVRANHGTRNINFALRRGGSITGRITVQGTGKPAGGVCVVASNSDPLGGGSAVTTRTGRYRISSLGTGSYRVAVMTTYGCEPSGQLLTPAGQPRRVHVVLGRPTNGINGLVRPGGAIAGLVTGPGGHAEPGMCVEASAKGGGVVSETTTGRNGRYQVSGLAPGPYDVRLGNPSCSDGPTGLASQWYNDAASRHSASTVTVSGGQVQAGVNAVLGADGTVSGSVTGTASAPLTGICVRAVPVSASGSTLSTTASQGSYTLAGVPPGRYRIEFQSGCGLTGYQTQWWDDAGSAAQATVIQVRSGAVNSNISAALTTG
jgi:hypothetical protein